MTTVKLCPNCGHRVDLPPEDGKRRAPKFDNLEVRQSILDMVARGNSVNDAALFAGVSVRSVQIWLQQGLEQRRRRVRGKRRDFLEAYEKAEARLRVTLVDSLHGAALKNPWLLVAMLERIAPERWSRTEAAIVRQERDRMLDIMKSEFADEPEVVTRFLGAVAGVVGARALSGTNRRDRPVIDVHPVKTIPPGRGGGS